MAIYGHIWTIFGHPWVYIDHVWPGIITTIDVRRIDYIDHGVTTASDVRTLPIINGHGITTASDVWMTYSLPDDLLPSVESLQPAMFGRLTTIWTT